MWCFFLPGAEPRDLQSYIDQYCQEPARLCKFKWADGAWAYPAICFDSHRDAMFWRLNNTGAKLLKETDCKCKGK